MSARAIRHLFLILAVLALPAVTSAQEATIGGTVRDTTGVVLPGVAVRAIHEATGVDQDTIHYQATMEDPKVYTRPWTIVFPLEREKEPGYEQLEEACHEGDHDAANFILSGFQFYQGPRFPPK
jgi:hypothetical protein